MVNKTITEKYLELKRTSGSHSPSLNSIKEKIPELKINVDACFLSNPYATELFLEYFKREMIDTNEIYSVLEFYPSQNKIIANYVEKQLDIEAGHIFICNGAIEAIQAVIHRYSKGKIMVILPTFSSYYEYATKETEVVFYYLDQKNNFKLDIDDYISKVKEIRPNTIVLINPNNPDGGYISQNELKKIINELSWVENVIIDESFVHFAYEDDDLTMKSIVSEVIDKENIIIIKSMSKDFGIAGLRCGYAAMSKNRVTDLLSNGYLWNSNGIAEYFFQLYSRNDFLDRYELVRKKYINESKVFFEKLLELENINIYPSRANFVLIELLNGLVADDVSAQLLCDHGVYVRNCNDKIGLDGEFIRVAARSNFENDLIIKALENVTQNSKKTN
jgi:histidinol-phosphate/aromatic aminotransferase/cobyric acid decarboxylase-like protein